MKILKPILVFACMISLVGCLDNNTNPEPIVEPTVKSEYYIANQSGIDLKVTYKIAFLPMDSTVIVSTDSTTKIFESSDIGGDPPPSSAFNNLRFYKKSDDKTSPVFIIEPIVNKNWNRTAGEINNVAKYELTITNEDTK